ncbi:hypothetical protein SFC65_20395 [Priestia filamentosa]|uniref:hypothetical protein n=1 Tax=Priestia filamentosa TaxID=1402861 RepID=UPI003981B8D2
MAFSFQTKGKPIESREVKVGEQYIYLIDFEEETNSPSPKGIPASEMLTFTTL